MIPFPQELRPQLPTLVGNVDYLTLRQRLEQIDALLRDSGVERDFVQRALDAWTAAASRAVTALEQLKFQQRSRRALRCTVLRTLLQEDYRGFSCQLAGHPLYQWFCQVDAVDQVRVPSKSEVQRMPGATGSCWTSGGSKRRGRAPRPNRFCGASMACWSGCPGRNSRRMNGSSAVGRWPTPRRFSVCMMRTSA